MHRANADPAVNTPAPAPENFEPDENVSFRVDRVFLQSIPTALFLIALGLGVLAFVDDLDVQGVFAAWVVIVAGSALTAYALYRRYRPGVPIILLAPIGLFFRMPFLKTIHIPWSEIKGVGIRDVSTLYPSLVRPRMLYFHDVTTVRVSKVFYDREIHVDSAFMRGPGWKTTFFPDGSDVDMALHHEGVGVTPADIFHAVEARWRAFNPRAEGVAVVQSPSVIARRRREPLFAFPELGPGATRVLNTFTYGLPLAIIFLALSNLAGIWEADYQRDARVKRDEWQAQSKKWEDDQARSAEERRKRDKEWQEFWDKNRF